LVAGRAPAFVAGRMPVFVVGRTPVLVVGRMPVFVVGRTPVLVVGRMPVFVVGRTPVLVVGRMPVFVAGRTPVFVIGRAPVLAAGRAPVAGLAVFAAGRAAGFAGAGLGGGDEFFFWSPQRSAEVSISVKSTISFLGIRLSDMFNLQITALSCVSLIAEFIGRSNPPWVLHNPLMLHRKHRLAHFCAYGCALWSETFS
jgi:hypothetical protein